MTTLPFNDWTPVHQAAFAKTLAIHMKSKKVDTFKRCMALANVNITIGAPDQTDGQFRIEKDEAAKVLAITLKEYAL